MKSVVLLLVALLMVGCGTRSPSVTADMWSTADCRDEEALRVQVEHWVETRDLTALVAATVIDRTNAKGCDLTINDYQMLCDLPRMPKAKISIVALSSYDRDKYGKNKVIAASADGKKRMEFLHAPMKSIDVKLFKESEKDEDQWSTTLPIVHVDGKWYIAGRIIVEE